MTKVEFLNELRNKLQVLPKEDLESRISFYSEMIDDRMDEGKTEEEAINEIGTVDEIVYEIAKDTPLVKLVKEKVKPKRALRVWEIILLILGFPVWFPLLTVAVVLAIVFYLLIWVFVIVAYAVEAALVTWSIGGVIVFFLSIINGNSDLISLGTAVMSCGGAILLYFGCKELTKLTIKLSKKIIVGIKMAIIGKGENK